ncbi:hypothetical protein XELAEV_18009244mg [Xenopus laevis]|uniref:Uncharacterized protein n=1 Tax=Xenopus laevis TaxID=8355 RepID=A0A974I0D6_XENLA|nr:hypothetical protein XELAEV_18009244mg [Xenopus laevis]
MDLVKSDMLRRFFNRTQECCYMWENLYINLYLIPPTLNKILTQGRISWNCTHYIFKQIKQFLNNHQTLAAVCSQPHCLTCIMLKKITYCIVNIHVFLLEPNMLQRNKCMTTYTAIYENC